MSWFMPSYGRPERLRELLDAPGGWPHTVLVLVNEDDPDRARYQQVADQLLHEYRATYGARDGKKAPPWYILTIPAGSRCADAHRWITTDEGAHHLTDNWATIGLLCDDHWPITPGWWKTMEQAAGDRYIAAANGSPQFPKIRSAVCFGGKLVEAMGSLVPAKMRHNFEDDLWDKIAEDFRILRPLKDVVVEHRHWVHGTARKDKTYERGSADYEQDRLYFQEWVQSNDRQKLYERIGVLVGGTIVRFDPAGIHLALMIPIQDDVIEAQYHKDIFLTFAHLRRLGVEFTLVEKSGGSHISKARERLLWDAYYSDPQPTHFMFIDADMGWEPNLITRLLATGFDFVAIPGVRKTDEIQVCANYFDGEQKLDDRTGFLRVKEVGAAFMLFSRKVVDRLIEAHPELRYRAPRPEYALFFDMLADVGEELPERFSEDFAFCRRWRDIGGDIWIDPAAKLKHIGKYAYTGCTLDIAQQPLGATPNG